jgi:hypothetical protein
MSRTVHEAARVLSPGGVFCACVSHPATDLGRFVADDPDADFVLRPSYFERRRVEDTLERDGLTVTCRGWTYTLEDYLMAFSDAGFYGRGDPGASATGNLGTLRQVATNPHVPERANGQMIGGDPG